MMMHVILFYPPSVQTVTSTALPESWKYQSDFRTLSHDNSKPNCIIRCNVTVMPIHHKSRLLNHAIGGTMLQYVTR